MSWRQARRWTGEGFAGPEDWQSANATSALLDLPSCALRGDGSNLEFQRLERVLIAEDDSELNGVLTRRLMRTGLQVISATDGSSALERYRSAEPDVVVLDLNLPGLDGFKFLHFVRHTPGLVSVPFLVITGRADEGLEERLAPMGVRRVLRKPLSMKLVVKEVVEAIEGL